MDVLPAWSTSPVIVVINASRVVTVPGEYARRNWWHRCRRSRRSRWRHQKGRLNTHSRSSTCPESEATNKFERIWRFNRSRCRRKNCRRDACRQRHHPTSRTMQRRSCPCSAILAPVGIRDKVVVDVTIRGHVPCKVVDIDVDRARRSFPPVGKADTVSVVVADVAIRPYDARTATIASRVRRHLFISSDIRIKAFTFNQN